MKKIWIPAALMALAACSMTNNAEKGQGDSQDITARLAITQVAESVPSEPSVDSVEGDGDCFLSSEIRFTPRNTRNDSRKARRQK